MAFRLSAQLRLVLRAADRRSVWRLLSSIGILAGMLATKGIAWAQGCPLCYNAAAATKAGGIQALRNGILILMIPPVLIVGLVCVMGIRRYRSDSDAEPDFGPAEDGVQSVPALSELPGGTR